MMRDNKDGLSDSSLPENNINYYYSSRVEPRVSQPQLKSANLSMSQINSSHIRSSPNRTRTFLCGPSMDNDTRGSV
jgi:hypothetical protein